MSSSHLGLVFTIGAQHAWVCALSLAVQEVKCCDLLELACKSA